MSGGLHVMGGPAQIWGDLLVSRGFACCGGAGLFGGICMCWEVCGHLGDWRVGGSVCVSGGLQVIGHPRVQGDLSVFWDMCVWRAV